MDSLGDRMKRYEATPRISLMRRTPVILRFDGNDTPTSRKRGTGIVRGECPMDRGWEVDFEIPIFKQDRQYIERFVYPVDKAEVSG